MLLSNTMPLLRVFGVILAISLLVIIHEFGHYIVARAFGMRVLTFSIGFGPAIVRWRPKGSDTVFQIAAIPVLAYVQIAGMNPREASEPHDRGSYQNATPIARFLTIAAGPLANYLAAGLALFLMVAIGGEAVPSTRAQVGRVMQGAPAATAGLRSDDTIVAINDVPVSTWDDLLRMTRQSQGRPLRLVVEREGHGRFTTTVTPRLNPETRTYMIGIVGKGQYRPVPLTHALEVAVVGPAHATVEVVRQLGKMFQREVPVQLVGPVGIVQQTVEQTKQGWRQGMESVAVISLNLFIFNLLPIPALDGGRLVVLGYEIATRRRPDPKFEARVLAASLMLMLGLFLVVTSREVWGLIAGWLNRG
jgi:regulator of sigma E protease